MAQLTVNIGVNTLTVTSSAGGDISYSHESLGAQPDGATASFDACICETQAKFSKV